MLDIDDWMLSCNKQINLFRKTQFQNFWGKILSNDAPSRSGPSSSLSEEAKSYDQKKEGDPNSEDAGDLIKFKS